MKPRPALILLSLICPLLLVLLTVPGLASVWLIAPLVCGLPVLLMRIGVGGRRPGYGVELILWLILTGSWLALGGLSATLELSRPTGVEAAWVLGTMFLGLGLVPLLLVAWYSSRRFPDEGLNPEDLRALREGRQS